MTDAEPLPSERTPVDAQRIVDTLHEPLLILDEDLKVRQVNPAYYRVFPSSPDETIGTSVSELGDGPFDLPVLWDKLDEIIENGGSFEKLEIDHHFGEAGRRVLRINGRKLVTENGEAEHILLAIQDVTEERKLEESLRRQQQELQHSNADLEQFAYAASHDLQEPLRMVSSYLQLLERRYREELDETAREFIEYAVDGANRMKSLINGLLQYSRVGRKEGELEQVDLTSLVDDVLTDVSRRIEELGATVKTDQLPTTYGYRDQLRRVVQNLIENALNYRGETPPEISVTSADAEEGEVHIVVRDNGPGIPTEAHEKVFHIFKQLDPHGSGRKGSGMGLALCRKIAERHQGRMWVESAPGEGAAFHVTLGLSPEVAP